MTIHETNEYNPHVLSAGANSTYIGRKRINRKIRPGPCPYYSLFAIKDGFIRYNPGDGWTKRIAPIVLLRTPGSVLNLEIPPLCPSSWVDFGVNRAARQKQSRHGTSETYVSLENQPSPMLVWGVEMPPLYGETLALDIYRDICLLNGYWWRDTNARTHANGLLMILLSKMVNHIKYPPDQDSFRSIRKPKLIIEAQTDQLRHCLEIAYQHLERGIDINHWAFLLNMPRQKLQKITKDELGKTPKEVLDHIQIEISKQAMIEHSLPMHQVAKIAGFNSRVAFTRAFIRCVGKSPTRWLSEKQSL